MSLETISKRGDPQNWLELDYIPCRLQFTFSQDNNHTIEFDFEHQRHGVRRNSFRFTTRSVTRKDAELDLFQVRPVSLPRQHFILVNKRQVNKHEYPSITPSHF